MRSITRCLFVVWAAWTLIACSPSPAAAQDEGVPPTAATVKAIDLPTYPFPSPHQINRGPGGYFSLWKMLGLIVLFLLWVKATDWVNRDCKFADMPYGIWNLVMFLPFLLSLLLLALTVPVFLAGFSITLLALGVPLLVYVVQRNGHVELHERVMTANHLRHVFSGWASRVGVKVDSERRSAHELGPPIKFSPLSGKDDQANQSALITARQFPGFVPAKELLHGALELRADKIMIDRGAENIGIRYQVDGMWHDGDPLESEAGSQVLDVLKRLAGADPAERRARQSGRFGFKIVKDKYLCSLVTQGTKTGERTILHIEPEALPFGSLADLGMREKMIEQLKDLLLTDEGLFVFCSLPSGGLTTTLNTSLRSTDRLMRDVIAIQDVTERLIEIENVETATYDGPAGETPDKIMPALMRKQPDLLIVRDLPNAATVNLLCEAAEEDHLVLTSIRAKEAVEALLRVLLLKVPVKTFAPVALGVLNVRLVRKLCEDCKEAYTPPPELLKKLRLPQDRVGEFYRPPTEPEKECIVCGGIGYIGRTGIFELLVVDPTLQKALIAKPKLDVLRAYARKAGHSTLQEEGIMLVVQGITSLPELMRVLKQ